MTPAVQKLVDALVPGDRLDLDTLPEELRQEFLDEFEGLGFTLSSDSIVGSVEVCPSCDGEGVHKSTQEACRKCDGYSLCVDRGRGLEPYRE